MIVILEDADDALAAAAVKKEKAKNKPRNIAIPFFIGFLPLDP